MVTYYTPIAVRNLFFFYGNNSFVDTSCGCIIVIALTCESGFIGQINSATSDWPIIGSA
jgi:hypothetical protein